MELFFQTSFGIPAEGWYIGLVILLILIIFVLLFIIYLMAKRNVALVDDNRMITKDSINGFQHVIEALNAIREQLQVGDNSIMGKINDTEAKIYDELVHTQDEIKQHLQYLRDKAR